MYLAPISRSDAKKICVQNIWVHFFVIPLQSQFIEYLIYGGTRDNLNLMGDTEKLRHLEYNAEEHMGKSPNPILGRKALKGRTT